MLANQRITAIRPTRRDPSRATVKVEDKAVATLSYKHIQEFGLEIGQPWHEELTAKVDEAAAFDKAMKAAMNRLGRRMLTRKKLDQKLRDKDFTQPVRQQVLDHLVEQGLLDDEAFGRALIRETLATKAAGPRLLRQKLIQQGVDPARAERLVDEAVKDGEGDDQIAQAVALGRTRLRSMRRVDHIKKKRRLYGVLARRGFTPDAIATAMKTLEGEMHGETPDENG